MAELQTPHEKVAQTPGKKNNNKNNNNKSKPSQKVKNVYCALCRRSYLKHEAQEHMHGMLHHRELETVLGKNLFHECQACKESSMGLKQYAQHISTAQHKARLKSLMSKNAKPPSLKRILGTETLDQILERNKILKTQERKQIRKKKKKQKQLAGQKQAEMQQGAARKNTVGSKLVKLQKSKQVKPRILKQVQEAHQDGSKNAVAQNKENKVSSLQRPPHQREQTRQFKPDRSACLSREPAGRGGHQPYVRDQFTQSTQQMRYDGNFSGNSQYSKVKTANSQTDRNIRRQHSAQGGATNMPGQRTWLAIRQQGHYKKQYDSAADFTSDQLPQNGAIIFHHDQKESTGPSQVEQEDSAQPASSNKPANAAPIRDVDVSEMLRQIRRALGVREPCRADREARRQNTEAATRSADQAEAKKEQPAGVFYKNSSIPSAGTTSVQSSLVSSPAPASHSGVHPSSYAPANSEQTVRMTQGTNQYLEESSVVASTSNGPSNSRERESREALDSQTSLTRCLGRTASSESNQNTAHKVRIAHESGKIQKPTMHKLLSSSGAKSKLNWREVHEEMRRKKQERIKGFPRFGIELANHSSDQEISTQAEDFPLSEGFHWESLPGSASGAHWTRLPPPAAQDTTVNEPHAATPSDSQMQEAVEQPGAAQEGRSSHTVKVVSVKVETHSDGDGDLGDHSGAKKRKSKVVPRDGIPDNEPGGKKRKTKTKKDQNQMDQLLAVSLREEELSHSLQDLDRSLIQARNALQAAYTEVQRLLLLRQQCTAEVNSLRTRRIEILQGMQESNVAERATTSSAGAAAAVQPRLSPRPSFSAFPSSSSQHSPSTNPASSINQPHPTPLALPTMPVKQEPQTVSCNPDTSQVPVNQPVTLFPHALLPSLLLTSSHLAAPTTTVTSLKQLKTISSLSVSPSPESSVRQQEQVTRERFKDSVTTVKLARDEADSDSEEEPTTEKPVSTLVPERDQNAFAAAQKDGAGNESDDSVEMMEPYNLEIIDIDESDNEETVSNVPVQREPPQKSVSVEFNAMSTQTLQQNEDERKVKPTLVPVKDVSVPPECVEGAEEEEPFLGAFENHTGPVHGLQVHEGLLYTCSGDNTARAYSLMSRECQAVFTGHTNKVNCLLVSSLPNLPARLFTGSSDQTIRCYSIKSKKCLQQMSLSDRVLCLHVAWNILFAGLANGSVASYDLKTLKQLDILECHGPRGVSCLGTAQEGARRVLLVGSYDSTISVRDAKNGLLLRSLEGHTKTVLCMKVVNDLVFSGSSDTSVHAHNIHTGELVRIYKGHSHAVTSIVILGKVMVTACLDKLVRVYELQSHDRLQVYGGHSDMVMCMAVHKSAIYTGCYDGSVQAVKLNLMKNHRCWWQNCSLIFGLADHLLQHLVRDHSNPNLEMVKCRWRGCSAFFAQKQSVRQELPEHMQSHAEKDSKVQP
ncbi:zinc finger protein 106 [Pagrus major]|uniref:zinc finger protein 106 n=1 Tax=Pagrus major TaxID=143350 RepID=UPI003CC89B33